MRIKTLALATTCALASGLTTFAAQAALPQMDTTIYGVISMDAISASDVYNAGTGKSYGKYYIDNGAQTSSRLGFKGSHTIKEDLKINFGLEAGLAPDTGGTSAGQLFNRGSWVGFNGKFGDVKVGRQWNLNDDTMGNFFVFGGYAVFRFSDFGDVSNLFNNSIKYYTPNFGGFQAGVMFGAGEAAASNDGGNVSEVVMSYGTGPFKTALSYHAGKDAAGNRTDRLTTGGVSYAIGPITPRIGVAVAHYPSMPSNATVFDVGVDWKVTAPLVMSFDYVSRNKKKSPNDTKFYRIRGVYAIDDSVSVYANVLYLKNDGAGTEHFYGDGRAGQNQRVFGVGFQYVF
ncbi:MAG: hypothetical protein JWL63_3437 [Rhodocyclales bacterium]|nr:hypothetical protein [Rhodocyclales bacterium]